MQNNIGGTSENNLIVSFDNLVFTLEKYDLYQKGDEVDLDIQLVRDNLRDLFNRLAVIEASNGEINTSIRKYQESVDLGFPFKMEVDDYDKILSRTIDIDILTDLANNQPIEENWRDMFKIEKSIDEKLTEFYIELDKNNQAFYYDDRMGTCHITLPKRVYSYDCTPFWDNAEGIAVCLSQDDDVISSYVIGCKEPTNNEELEKFKTFYGLQVSLMIKGIS